MKRVLIPFTALLVTLPAQAQLRPLFESETNIEMQQQTEIDIKLPKAPDVNVEVNIPPADINIFRNYGTGRWQVFWTSPFVEWKPTSQRILDYLCREYPDDCWSIKDRNTKAKYTRQTRLLADLNSVQRNGDIVSIATAQQGLTGKYGWRFTTQDDVLPPLVLTRTLMFSCSRQSGYHPAGVRDPYGKKIFYDKVTERDTFRYPLMKFLCHP